MENSYFFSLNIYSMKLMNWESILTRMDDLILRDSLI